MDILITGSNGFSGFYLAKYIAENYPDELLTGIDLSAGSTNRYITNYFSLSDFSRMKAHFKKRQESLKLFHLGGLIGNRPLSELIEANVTWTSRYLEFFSELANPVIFINIGSSAEYGKQATPVLSEDLPRMPVTRYGISKKLQTDLVMRTGYIHHLNVCSTLTFNLIGPGLSENLVVGQMLGEFQKVINGEQESIFLGRLDSIRTFVDVRDAVKFYWQLSKPDHSGKIINVASDNVFEIRELYDMLCDLYGIKPEIVSNVRGPMQEDVDKQKADLTQLLQIVPETSFIPMKESLRDMKKELNERIAD